MSQTFQSLRLKIVIPIGGPSLTPLSGLLPSHWAGHTGSACGSSAPLPFHWHLLGSGSHSHFLPMCLQSFFFFFCTTANFVFLCPTALPRPPEEGPLSASPLTPHPEPSQVQTTCLVIAAQSWPFVVITLCYSRNSMDPNCFPNQGRLKG